MYSIFNKFYNLPTEGNAKKQLSFCLFFIPVIIIFWGLDSKFFAIHYFDGRWVVNVFVLMCFFYMLTIVDSRLRRLMLIMVPLSYVGEILFCNILDVYDYRLDRIPFYVPFGHAMVYGAGVMLSLTPWAQTYSANFKKIFPILFACIFLIAGLIYNDILSLFLGVAFYGLLSRKGWNPIYYYIAIYVLIVEFVGTYFGVWAWEPLAIGFIPTANPPVGAVSLYIGGDIVLIKIMRLIEKRKWLAPINFTRQPEKW